MLELNQQNYHSQQANIDYMSNSQFGGWMSCPAREFAKVYEGWGAAPISPFVIGSYVDCQLLTPEVFDEWFFDNIDALIETGCISKRDKKTKNTPLKIADMMIERAKSDAVFMSYLDGCHQNIYTFPFAGAQWRIMCDSVNKERQMLVDLKTSKNITEESWVDRRTIFDFMAEEDDFMWTKGPFYEQYNYWRQGAIYRYGIEYNEGFSPDFYIAAVSKQDPPDIGVFRFANEERMRDELSIMKNFMPQVLRWKSGKDECPRCERCEYCRATKRIKEPINAISIAC